MIKTKTREVALSRAFNLLRQPNTRAKTSGPSGCGSSFEHSDLICGQLGGSNEDLSIRVETLTQMLSQARSLHQEQVVAKELISSRLEKLLKLLPTGVVLLDVKGRVSECNPAAEDLLGEPLKGELWLDVIRRSFSPRLDDGHEVSLKDGRRVSLVTRSLETEPGQLIVLTDMTETRALQEHLSRHQRLSALGKMVASLAHQIRTPLSAAILYGEHLANPELDSDTQQRFAAKLNSRLNNLEQQVRDMLVFARGNMPQTDFINTEQLTAGIEVGMEALLNRTNTLCSIQNEAPGVMIRCNREALVGAILNLVNNAIESVESFDGAACINIELQQQADHLRISVEDDGPGIEIALQEKIMEPFFTTKSQGTGLGMSVVQAVIRAHGGEFSIVSVVGQGTQVTLTLPVNG